MSTIFDSCPIAWEGEGIYILTFLIDGEGNGDYVWIPVDELDELIDHMKNGGSPRYVKEADLSTAEEDGPSDCGPDDIGRIAPTDSYWQA